jgi:type IV secretion system protein VirB3
VLFVIGHTLAVWAARTDAQFVEVFARHAKYPSHLEP